ncbi:MAG: glycosyltransferase family 2 protein [Chitinophagaceae bacterium]
MPYIALYYFAMAFGLSIIIVNYNVRYFLEYCLLSLRKASIGIHVQTIVIDNASSDDDYSWMAQKFPETVFVRNNANLGFGKASNQGLTLATGRYVLFLNPDTLLPDNALADCLAFFGEKKDCGALGVQMVDGKGIFLSESKRAVPTPRISFFKFSGLEKLFPKSKTFGRYALGYLDKNGVWEVPVLAGAFLMARRSLLGKVGGFDEAFFMYGEDIDLSYRLQQDTGFKNYYLGTVRILHFKGESSKQNTLHYHRIFNEAMHVFIRKYHTKTKAMLISAPIRLGTWIRSITLQIKRKKKAENRTSKRFFLMGDSQARQRLATKLQSRFSSIQLSNTVVDTDSIVYCIGENFTIQNALADMEKQPDTVGIYWFDPETDAIIGNSSKDETGTVWRLNPEYTANNGA